MDNIYNYRLSELKNFFKEKNEKEFKATQVFEWIYKKRIKEFNKMSNIKKETIKLLEEKFNIEPLKILTKQIDTDVCKYLFELKDKNKIEAVLMKHDYGNSLCASTQVGCNMSCAFCESGSKKPRII